MPIHNIAAPDAVIATHEDATWGFAHRMEGLQEHHPDDSQIVVCGDDTVYHADYGQPGQTSLTAAVNTYSLAMNMLVAAHPPGQSGRG